MSFLEGLRGVFLRGSVQCFRVCAVSFLAVSFLEGLHGVFLRGSTLQVYNHEFKSRVHDTDSGISDLQSQMLLVLSGLITLGFVNITTTKKDINLIEKMCQHHSHEV